MGRKSSDVIKEAQRMIDDGYVYVYGYKGTKITAAQVKSLAKSYPSVFTSSILSMALKKVGKIGIDCSGFVNKAAGTNLGGSTEIKDNFPVKYKISDTDHLVNGMGIWRQGHIAIVHVDKNGKASIMEAKGTAYDLTVTSWKERASHFTYYGKIAGVDYQGANVYGIGKVTGAKTKGACRLYKKVDTKGGKKASLDNGSIISVIEDLGNGWSKVWYNGNVGYIKNTAIKLIGLSTYKEATLKHNAYGRKENRKASKKIVHLKKGDKVKVICKRKYWSNVIANGINCWVATKYL